MGELTLSEQTVIDTPSTGQWTLAPKSDGLYQKDDAGVEQKLQFGSDSPTRNDVHVSKSGNDSTGDGSISEPFLTIGAAITYINANYTPSPTDNYCIQVAAGNYTEGTLALPNFVSLWGKHYRTKVIASSTSIDLITTAGKHTIRDLLLTGVSGTGKYLIKATGTESARLLIQNVAFLSYEVVGTISNGFYGTCTGGTLDIEVKGIDFGDVTENCIRLDADTRLAAWGVQIFDSPLGTIIDANGNCSYSLYNLEIRPEATMAIGVDHGNTGASSAYNCNVRNATIPVKKFNNGPLLLQNVALVSAGAQITNFENLEGLTFDEIEGEDSYKFFTEVNIGTAGGGVELCVGEGDSYTLGMKAYTYNGSSFVDVTDEATSTDGSTISFPSGTTRAIYLTTQRTEKGTATPLKFFGTKVSVDTAASSDGEIVAEIWTGSAWVEFNHMSTESGDNYYPHAKQIFQRTGFEQITFDNTIEDSWVVSDPVGLGTDTYWIRYRMVTAPTTEPTIQQFKIHSNRSEMNPDGYMEHFGKARPVLSYTLPPFVASINSPTDSDLFFDDSFSVGKLENNYEGNVTDQTSQVVYLPDGIDTSCPIRLKAIFSSDGTSTNDADFTISWIVNREEDPIYPSAAAAPTTNPRKQSVNVSLTPTGQYDQNTLLADLDVSDYISNNTAKKPDMLAIQIQRNGSTDANNDDLALAVVNIFYVKKSSGSHV